MSSATTLLSSVSAVSLPGPTHTPSQTPLIAGSLTGLIVLLVCLVTLFLLHRRRLFAQRIRQQENFSSNYLRASLHLRYLSNSISLVRQTNAVHPIRSRIPLLHGVPLPCLDHLESLRSLILSYLQTLLPD